MTAKKADPEKTERDALMARAQELGIALDANETISDLTAKIFEAENKTPEPKGELTRRKVSRGSRRRIERALTDLNNALDAAVAEFDAQAFMADDEGDRIGDWPAVTELRQAQERVNARVNALFAQD